MSPTDEALLQIWQAHRGDPLLCEALFDECLAPKEYVDQLDAVRSAMNEESDVTIDQIKDIGQLTSGLRDNAADICDIWVKRPLRRAEFGKRERDEISAVVLGLWTILREMEKQEAA